MRHFGFFLGEIVLLSDVFLEVEEKDFIGVDVFDELVVALNEGGVLRGAGLGEFENEEGILPVDGGVTGTFDMGGEAGSFDAIGDVVSVSGEIHHGGEDVGADDGGGGVGVGRDPGAAHDEGNPDAAFADVVFVTALRVGLVEVPLLHGFAEVPFVFVAVVGGVDDVGVVGDTELVDAVEHQADAGVEVFVHRGPEWVVVIVGRLVSVLGFVLGNGLGTSLILEMIGEVRDLEVEGIAGGDLLLHELIAASAEVEDQLGVIGIFGVAGSIAGTTITDVVAEGFGGAANVPFAEVGADVVGIDALENLSE